MAVRPMIAPRATAAATSIAVHCDRVRRGAIRSPASATTYMPAAFAARDRLLGPALEQPGRHATLLPGSPPAAPPPLHRPPARPGGERRRVAPSTVASARGPTR